MLCKRDIVYHQNVSRAVSYRRKWSWIMSPSTPTRILSAYLYRLEACFDHEGDAMPGRVTSQPRATALILCCRDMWVH
jgi:hypothetical protein